MKIAMAVAVIAGVAGTASALPPNAPANLRPGANHHTGDDGFVATEGRAPSDGDEKLRMHDHFVAVRARLAAGTATRPELAAQRQKLLAALDRYIAAGTTPENEHLPWRTPVFIDDRGTICAVGYLIQDSAGRELAEKVAASHRYSFIEDIARDMPEVRDWVAASGFTLDEIGQIQPGYMGPQILQWRSGIFFVDSTQVTDGDYDGDGHLHGRLRHGHMTGPWLGHDDDGKITGSGMFHAGAGRWTSYFATGSKLAEGRFEDNAPEGRWKFYFASGRLAAEGRFHGGVRTGAWTFFYDVDGAHAIAAGAFGRRGYVSGTWKHYDPAGKLVATSRIADIPDGWTRDENLFAPTSFVVDLARDGDGVRHRVHEGAISGDSHRLDELVSRDGAERVYYLYDRDLAFDDTGHLLVKTELGWRSDRCAWSARAHRAARAGDIVALHGQIWDAKADGCERGAVVSDERSKRIDALVGALASAKAASSEQLTDLALGNSPDAQLADALLANMEWDIEWPHIDGLLAHVFHTLPGYSES